ncbi:folate-binding protein [Magnetovibrio sp.]|uniref:CAF17-like 4Fe-4S cluster assembly/insertion protein YgfZ n=1 Tax=Magnetovibrio sp. TaxID=2024836 RepID=UPI002F954C2B
MSDKTYCPLPARGLIKIEGPDARDYLQGLISQDIKRVDAGHAVYSAFLTPQGKFMYDFFAFEMAGALVLDCEGERRSDFFKRLSMYKLRSDVQLSDISDDYQVYGVLDGLDFSERGACKVLGDGVLFADPRLLDMGCRAVLPKNDTSALDAAGLSTGDYAAYEHRRMELGLADGSRDMSVDKALLLENGFEELDGVSFTKGCFMGQELTARTRYRGLVKKRLLPVTIDGPAPQPGAILELDGREAGEMKTSSGDVGLALVRLDALKDDLALTCEGATVRPHVPAWVQFQDAKDA